MIFLFIIQLEITSAFFQISNPITKQTLSEDRITYIYQPQQDSNKYIFLQLNVENYEDGQSQLLMSCSFNYVSYFQFDMNLNATYKDLSSYYQNSTYHSILIPPIENYNKSDQYFITIFIPIKSNYQYTLNISTNISPICPKNCGDQLGTCIQGICDCKQSFLDLDCSRKGVELLINKNTTYMVKGYGYLYYQQQNSSSNKLSIVIQNLQNDSNTRIQAYLMLEDLIYGVPSQQNFLMKSDMKSQDISFIVETDQIRYLNQLLRFQRIIITTYSSNQQTLQITVQNVLDNNDFRIQIACAGAAAVLIIILIIIFCILSKSSSNARPQLIIETNQQQQLNLQIINRYLPKYKYLQIFDTAQFKRKSQTKQLFQSCPVCLLEFEDDTECRFTSCLHIFHSECLESWFLKHQNCPYCRKKMNYDELLKCELEFNCLLGRNHIQQIPKNNFQIDEKDLEEFILNT